MYDEADEPGRHLLTDAFDEASRSADLHHCAIGLTLVPPSEYPTGAELHRLSSNAESALKRRSTERRASVSWSPVLQGRWGQVEFGLSISGTAVRLPVHDVAASLLRRRLLVCRGGTASWTGTAPCSL
jgi:hypothetical protein